ncbi:MAG: TIM barrel protein [Candidatus Acidiferrum sp.]
MRRREFLGACAGAAAASHLAASPGAALSPSPSRAASSEAPGPFPLSVMLWTVHRELPFDQRLAMVAEAGYSGAELVGEYKDWSKEEFARVRRKRRELGLTFDATSGISSSLCDPAQREALLKEVSAQLNVLEELESSKLILLSGNRVPGLTLEQLHAGCVDAIKAAADLAAKRNVELLIENIDPEENPKYFLTSVAEGFAVVREVARPNVKFLYDFFHEQIAEGNLIEKLQKNIDLVGLVHIADVPGRHEPGTGEINYANIFRKLHELNYGRYAAMEFLPTGETVAALRAAREMVLNATGTALHS